MSEFEALIKEGNELRGTKMGSAKFAVWANDVRAAVKPYGDGNMSILERALESGIVIMDGPNYNDDAIDAVNELLVVLNERMPEDARAQDALINQKQAEARATLQSKFSQVTVHGDATFGDNSSIAKITVGEFMAGLLKEVEAMPEGTDKHGILDSLKDILANPTFATVSGSVLSEVLKKFMGGQ